MPPFYVKAYDGLRLVLLLAVLEYHYLLVWVPASKIWFLSYALSCFFCLSGFLITHLLARYEHQGWARWRILAGFYARRALRIFPAYYVVLLAAALWLGVPYLEWHLTYLFNIKLFWLSLAPGHHELTTYLQDWDHNGVHLWSMGVEEQFYLLYPLFWLATPPTWRTPGLLLGLLSTILYRLTMQHTWPLSFYGALLPGPGEYILWGCLLAWLDLNDRMNWARRPLTLYLALAGLLLAFALDTDVLRYQSAHWRPPPHQTLYAALLALLLLGIKHSPQSWPVRLLSLRPLTGLGKISYSAYLVHLFLNPWLDRMAPEAPRPLVGPLLALAVAGLMWVTFEGPANRARLLSGRGPSTPNSHP